MFSYGLTMRLLLLVNVILVCVVLPLQAQRGDGGKGGGGRGGGGRGGGGKGGGRRTPPPTEPPTTITTPEEIVTTTEEIVTTPEEIVTTPEVIVTTTEEVVTTTEEVVTTPEATTTSGPSFPPLTTAQVNALKESINVLLDANADAVGNEPNLIAGLVRLAFHDCVGGCDGCINMDNPENAGLDVYIDMIEEAFTGNTDILSRADFWALASITANERAAENCRPRGRCTPDIPAITFRTGRKDCVTSPSTTTEHTFPNALADLNPTQSFFANAFGFNSRETVTILGAHTLGRARRQNSGFRNPWVGGDRTLDNDYYRELLNADWNWTQVDVGDGKWQWVHGDGRRLMLNADMCIFKDIDVSSGSGESSCPYSGANACPNSVTAGIVQEFANDNSLWIQEYGAVFQKLIENGYNSDDFQPIVQGDLVDGGSGSGENPSENPVESPDPINSIGIMPIFEEDNL